MFFNNLSAGLIGDIVSKLPSKLGIEVEICIDAGDKWEIFNNNVVFIALLKAAADSTRI